jgi:hypothetical protein
MAASACWAMAARSGTDAARGKGSTTSVQPVAALRPTERSASGVGPPWPMRRRRMSGPVSPRRAALMAAGRAACRKGFRSPAMSRKDSSSGVEYCVARPCPLAS